jgi:uncharacterized protein (DUF488 family)
LPTIDAVPRSTTNAAFVSVGYQERNIDEFVELRTDTGVEILVNVRLNAISRKRGFSKTALSNALAEAGIAYRHERELGNPKDNREAFRQGLASARNRYLAHLSNGASGVYDEVVSLAGTNRVALLCYERDHTECHRSRIIDTAQRHDPSLRVVKI